MIFPADDVGYGFDNIADVLATPPILVEMELAAAASVIDAAFRDPEARRSIMSPPADGIPAVIPQVHAAGADRAREQAAAAGRELRSIRSWRGSSTSTTSCARSPTGHFAGRRPTTRFRDFSAIVLSAEKDGEEPETALRLGLSAVLAVAPILSSGSSRCATADQPVISTWPRGCLIFSGAACPTVSSSN